MLAILKREKKLFKAAAVLAGGSHCDLRNL